MANTIAKATGSDSSRNKETHRLGSKSSTGEANTWRTFTTTHVNADGSGFCRIMRDGEIIHYYKWGPE
jgi:hypothetical protein